MLAIRKVNQRNVNIILNQNLILLLNVKPNLVLMLQPLGKIPLLVLALVLLLVSLPRRIWITFSVTNAEIMVIMPITVPKRVNPLLRVLLPLVRVLPLGQPL